MVGIDVAVLARSRRPASGLDRDELQVRHAWAHLLSTAPQRWRRGTNWPTATRALVPLHLSYDLVRTGDRNLIGRDPDKGKLNVHGLFFADHGDPCRTSPPALSRLSGEPRSAGPMLPPDDANRTRNPRSAGMGRRS